MKSYVIESMLNYMKNDEKKLFITFARVIATISVIMVHLCQQSNSPMIKASAQVFITGVTTFIILSGYLYGYYAKKKSYPVNYRRWFFLRAKKILIPYYVVVAAVLVLNIILIKDSNISVKEFLMFFICVQDCCGEFFYRIVGLGHLWYITMLVLLYIVISLMMKYRDSFKKYGGYISLFICIVQIFITIFFNVKVGRYIFYLLVGIISFWCAYADSKKLTMRGYLTVTLTVVVLWCIRLYLYFKNCDSSIYNNLYIYYTQVALSAWIMMSLYILNRKGWLWKNTIIEIIDSLSYEIFLTHFVFIVGPISIVGKFGNLAIEGVIVYMASILSGFVLSKICGLFNR